MTSDDWLNLNTKCSIPFFQKHHEKNRPFLSILYEAHSRYKRRRRHGTNLRRLHLHRVKIGSWAN